VITVVEFERVEEEVDLAPFSTISRHPNGGTMKNIKFCSQPKYWAPIERRNEHFPKHKSEVLLPEPTCLVLKKIG
jgi:hypothetical protein